MTKRRDKVSRLLEEIGPLPSFLAIGRPAEAEPFSVPDSVHEQAKDAARRLGAYLEMASVVATVCEMARWLSDVNAYPFRDWEYQRKRHGWAMEMVARIPMHWFVEGGSMMEYVNEIGDEL